MQLGFLKTADLQGHHIFLIWGAANCKQVHIVTLTSESMFGIDDHDDWSQEFLSPPKVLSFFCLWCTQSVKAAPLFCFFACVFVLHVVVFQTCRYNASDGNNSQSNQSSGAYIFRPNSSTPFLISKTAKTETIQVQSDSNMNISYYIRCLNVSFGTAVSTQDTHLVPVHRLKVPISVFQNSCETWLLKK